MRIVVKSRSAAADKWERRAGSAGQEYKQGVETTGKDWEASSKAAEPAYKLGVTEAANAGRYGTGVAKAGNQKWRANASALGPDRFASGVAQAKPAYTAGIGPVLAALSAVDLTARGPVGSAGNLGRVTSVVNALRMLRTGRR